MILEETDGADDRDFGFGEGEAQVVRTFGGLGVNTQGPRCMYTIIGEVFA